MKETTLSKILSKTFLILFGLGFFVWGILGAIACGAEKITRPSGWYTWKEYQDASLVHSSFWLFIFVAMYLIVFFFLCFTIPLYGLFSLIMLLIWFCKNTKSALRTAKSYGVKEALNFCVAKAAMLKQAFVDGGYGFKKKVMLKKIFCALLIGLFITQFFSFNPIALLFSSPFVPMPPVLQALSSVIGVGSLISCVFVLLMF